MFAALAMFTMVVNMLVLVNMLLAPSRRRRLPVHASNRAQR